MTSWIRLPCESAVVGWTAKLSNAQYGVWVKLAMVVRQHGANGSIERDRGLEYMEKYGVSLADMEELTRNNEHVTMTQDRIAVDDSHLFACDPTATSRQRRHYEKQVSQKPNTTTPNAPTLAGDMEQVFESLPQPSVPLTPNETTARRLASVYVMHTKRNTLRYKAHECFREALDAGIDAHDLENAVAVAPKLALPWEIVNGLRAAPRETGQKAAVAAQLQRITSGGKK